MKERGTSGVASEAGKSMRNWQWAADKVTGATVCPWCKRVIYPSAAPGAFDFKVQRPIWNTREMQNMSVEVKYAKTSFNFSLFDDKKRSWAQQMSENHPETELWLWLCLGRSIRDKKYPRQTFLFPLQLFYELEEFQKAHGRKSIPYNCLHISPYELDWQGNGLWTLRPSHPLAEK